MFELEVSGKVSGNPSLLTGAMGFKSNGKQFMSFEICSGKWGKGALEEGKYKVLPPHTLPDNKDTLAFKKEGFAWVAQLYPQFKTDRTDICIHPDGNIYGTLGCVGIQKLDIAAYYLLSAICKIEKDVILTVKYI